jgi:hypothetical protein
MQAVASGRSSALPSLSLCQSAPRRHSRSALRVSGILGLKSEAQGVRLECETRRRVEVRAERGGAAHQVENSEERSRGVGDEAESRDVGVSAGASGAGVPSALYSLAPLMVLADATGYSQASYNTTLGLFLLSLPGVWSLVKRATKSKVRGFFLSPFCGSIVWCIYELLGIVSLATLLLVSIALPNCGSNLSDMRLSSTEA